jgi:AbrB family looped-hinge helix DNA binding protein
MGTKSTTIQERIGRIGQRRQVVIPREMLETLNIREGDLVAFTQKQNGVLMKPKRVVDPDDVLTPAEGRNQT